MAYFHYILEVDGARGDNWDSEPSSSKYYSKADGHGCQEAAGHFMVCGLWLLFCFVFQANRGLGNENIKKVQLGNG